jgi:hypothetical protein
VTNNLNISANSILNSKRIQGINQGTKWVLLMKKNKSKKFCASVPIRQNSDSVYFDGEIVRAVEKKTF